MIRSMTGFGRAVQEIDGYVITVELKSVNHRYFEFSSRVPRQYGFIEDKLKSFVNSRVSRGKVDCFVGIEALNTEAAIARFPDVLVVRKVEEDEDKIWSYVQTVAAAALDKFVAMREVEGAKMKADVAGRAQTILDCVAFVEERSPQTVREYNEKLAARVHELLGDVTLDEGRLLQEMAIFADKVAVAEETVRLRSHIAQLGKFLEAEEPIGRKMDFLVQEINREANTIGSKASDVAIGGKVIDIKAEVEKIREQIQNIE